MSELNYLEKLLDGAEVERLPLGLIAEIGTDNHDTKDAIAEGKYIFYARGRDPLRLNEFDFDETAIITAGDGVGVGKVFHYAQGKYALHQRAYRIVSSESLNPRYLYHYIVGNFGSYVTKASVHASVTSLRKPMFLNFKIPIPCPSVPEKSLAIQSEIVRILDAFTTHTAELTARKKQYNYYREQLLSFDDGEVEYLPMGDKRVGEFIRGGTFQKKDFTDFGVGCIHYGQIYTYYGTYTNTTKTFISESLARKCRKAESGNLIIATTSENDDDVCKAVAWLGYDDIAASSDACIYKHTLNPKYVSYFFQTECFQRQKKQYITGAKVRRVNASNLAQILIPVPSPEEQARIVAILDKFDKLTGSITEDLPREIELRQKQYEYYRDLLFSFPKPESVNN